MKAEGIRFAALLASFAASCACASGVALAAEQCGKAAWFAPGGVTASGEPNSGGLTAAHRTLPFGTKVRVTNLKNDRSVVVRINDRGPFAGGRVIDLSREAASKLGYIRAGVAKVRVTVIDGPDVNLPSPCKGEVVAVSASVAPTVTAGDTPVPSDPPPLTEVPSEELTARFAMAFRAESWSEFEMRKAMEAILPSTARRNGFK